MAKFQKIPIRADHVQVGSERTIPGLFPEGSGMRRFVTAPDLMYRAGYTKVAPGQGFKTFFWYDEFWVMMEGEAEVTAIDRPSGATMHEHLVPHEYVFIPAGTRISLENRGSEPLLFTYIALPASNKHSPWITSMTEEDMEDIRARNEHTKEGFEAEAKRGQRVGA